MNQGPVSSRHVDLVLDYHCRKKLNDGIFKSGLPGLLPVSKLARADHVDETLESQVDYGVTGQC